MKTIEPNLVRSEPAIQNGRTEVRRERENDAEARHERWAHCYVNWTSVFIGALATFSMVLMFGLVGTALGTYLVGSEHRVADLKNMGVWTLIFSVCGAFFSSVIGGWVAAKIAGILHAEPAMLHGAFAWLVMVPLLVICADLGAASHFGGWYGALGPNSATNLNTPFVHPDFPGASASAEEIATFRTQQIEYNRNVIQWNEKTTRNGALMAVTALLLGLLGSVVGAWLASGEPMNFSHYRTREPIYTA